MLPLSATLIVRDEEGKVEGVLEQLQRIASEIVVVDSFSTDATVEICRRVTDRVIQRELTSFSDQKNFAASLARHDWILNLDADERLDVDLEAWIRGAFRDGPPREVAAYCFPRKTFDARGQWVFRPYSYPGFHSRLYDRRLARWFRPVHETLEVEGKKRFVPHHILHTPDRGKHPGKVLLYAALAASGPSREEAAGPKRWSSGTKTLLFCARAMFVDLGFLRRGPRFWAFGLRWLWISLTRAGRRPATTVPGGGKR